LEQFGLRGVAFGKRAESTALFLESAAFTWAENCRWANSASCSRRWRKIRFARRGVSGGIQPGFAAGAAQSGEIVQAAAAISVQPPRRGDAGAGIVTHEAVLQT
jgi:hypothetical protein